MKSEGERDYDKNSLICNIIAEREDWCDYFAEKYPKIRVSLNKELPLALFKYRINADFSDPVVQEARGIIINYETQEVVCWPFRKFGECDESYADTIDWASAVVKEKVDGSLIKLWFNKLSNKWQLSTNGTIHANEAMVNEKLNFEQYAKSAENWSEIECKLKAGELNEDCTYMFELAGFENRLVVIYEETKLYYLATRSNITGEYVDDSMRFSVKPAVYEYNSLEECISALDKVGGAGSDNLLSSCALEGYVVNDKSGNRIKVKTDSYKAISHVVSGTTRSRALLLNLLYHNKIDITAFISNYPKLGRYITYYALKVQEFKYETRAVLDLSRRLYELLDGDGAEVAKRIAAEKFSFIAFRGLGNDLTLEEIYEKTSKGSFETMLAKNIPEYEPHRYGYLFEGLEQYTANESEE